MSAMSIEGLPFRNDYIPALGKIKVLGRRGERHDRSRLAALALFAVTVLGGCATGPRLESVLAPTQPVVTLTEAGIGFTVLPNTWSAYPGDLSRYYTPVEIRIENTRDDDLQIRFEDFFALDDGNRQYRAVPPLEVARVVSGLNVPPRSPQATLVAGPWYPYGRRYWGPYSGPYWGPYAPWWLADPYYYSYAWPRPAVQDVLTLGLREGRLLAGASVQGFVYFQLATERGNLLTVSWTPRLPSGAGVAPFSAQFRILR